MDWNEIRAAWERIAPLVRETPIEPAVSLGGGVWLKLEHLQHTGSFKFRGASNKIARLGADQTAHGVIAASNGNHGLGVAAAAADCGIPAEVYVSSQVSPVKAARIRALGAQVREVGDDPLTAELAARRDAERRGVPFLSPYNDLDVIAGQGTLAVELHRQLAAIDAVFAAVGGGGLIGGIGTYLKAVSPRTEIVGCWPETSPVLLRCLEAGRMIEVPEQPTLSESTAGGLEPGSITLDICRGVIDRAVLVSENEIHEALHRMLASEHWLVEGAAGVAVAAYRKEAERYRGKRVEIVLCGRNVSPEVLARLR